MDSTTRRKIDALRDTLVGKLPVPTQQVEQITLALLYKFMYDLDEQNVELGGARQFFTNGYKRYAWNNIIDKSLSGAERVAAYGEALEKMAQNPKLPQLFRDIFARAYLPFRDPQTLNLFLQQIDDFTYEHSEDLGDAFEYLLSVMGSQGDAGQFRTPRHIIDFIVEAVDPDLDMRILDPACGTAGFLISAYKHIMMKYADDKGKPGAKLTPAQKKKLAQQFTGYDISHDMVRLSLVNMYLHNLPEPKIYEYDALTSEERWAERAECILANPPFMTPKGGIRPHSKFRIPAKRSEILFVDYIIEHLVPRGKAGIIVPESITSQADKVYKDLRKWLVDENLLYAIVSLPAEVFLPYTSKKTSILFIDREIAHIKKSILFVKIESDGFELGAQRRPIESNDLVEALACIKGFQSGVSIAAVGLEVPKAKIAEDGLYILTADKYKEGAPQSAPYPWRTVASLVETITPPSKILKTNFGEVGSFPIIDQSQEEIAGWTNDNTALIYPPKPLVIFGDHTCAVKLVEVPFAQGADGIKILKTNDELDPRFLYHILRAYPLQTEGYQRHFSILKRHEIPLPPLRLQKKLVSDVEAIEAEIRIEEEKIRSNREKIRRKIGKVFGE